MKKKNINLIIGLSLVGFMLALIIIGSVATPYDPEAMNPSLKMAGVSREHIMGCDNFGRDIFSRVMVGSRNTLFVALTTIAIGAGAGLIMGSITGYFRGFLDDVITRINDIVLAFPSVLLALVLISLLGPGEKNVVIALGIAFTPSFTRIVRGEIIRCRNFDYVLSAKLAGAGNMRIIFVHILPNIFPVLLSSIMIGFNNAVLAEAGMSYLGIGVTPPDASLGRMLSEAQTYIFSNPGYALFPGIIIIILVLGFSLTGEGLREVRKDA